MAIPKINAHCHFFNFQFFPYKMVRKLTGVSEIIAQNLALARKPFNNLGIKIPLSLEGHQRAGEFLDELIKDLPVQVNDYMNTLNNLDFQICVPLMMDLEPASNQILRCNYDFYSYEEQINFISEITAQHPFQIYPFVMFDPRRNDSYELCVEALEDKGFIGIKMYPALGYSPYWETNKNRTGVLTRTIEENEAKRAAIRQELMYKYCNNNNIPITTHQSPYGAYNVGLTEPESRELTEIASWEEVLKQHNNLKINFAHFGGNYLLCEGLPEDSENYENRKKAEETSKKWQTRILELIKLYPNVYTDLSYHDMALQNRTITRYFTDLLVLLNNDNYNKRILFGTDTPMISSNWSDKDYIDAFNSNINDNNQKRLIMSENTARFLFGDQYKIPERYIKFLEKKKVTKPGFDWLKDDYTLNI